VKVSPGLVAHIPAAKAALILVGLAVGAGGCKKPKSAESAPTVSDAARAEPAPEPAAAAEPAKAPAAPAASGAVDCDAILTEADLSELCGASLGLATPAGERDNIGPDRTCSRRFSDGSAGSLSLLLARLSAPAALAAADPAWENVKPIAGLGDEARSFENLSRGGDRVYKLELRKGDLDVLLFTSSLKPGSEPCVQALEAVAARVAARLP